MKFQTSNLIENLNKEKKEKKSPGNMSWKFLILKTFYYFFKHSLITKAYYTVITKKTTYNFHGSSAFVFLDTEDYFCVYWYKITGCFILYFSFKCYLRLDHKQINFPWCLRCFRRFSFPEHMFQLRISYIPTQNLLISQLRNSHKTVENKRVRKLCLTYVSITYSESHFKGKSLINNVSE